MNSLKSAKLILLFTILLSLIQVIYYYSVLPESVAIHFNFSGDPDSRGSKEVILLLNPAIILFNSLIFLFIPKLLKWLGNDSINIPNKNFWLSSSRRDDTIITFSKFLLWIGILTNILLLLVFQQVYEYNAGSNSEAISYSWIFIVIYLGILTFLIVKFYKRFKQIPE